MGTQVLRQRLASLGAFRVDALPADIRRAPFLPQRLHSMETRGLLRRVRRGAYVVVPSAETSSQTFTPDRFVVASLIANPYAISFYSALEIRGLAESTARRVTIQSPNRIIPFDFERIEYRGVFGPVDFGVETERRGSVDIRVTDIERTILDCLRYPKHAGGLDEFLRALEGVQRQDILTIVLEQSLRQGAHPPDWLKLRSDLGDRRPELSDLADAALLTNRAGKLLLSVTGLLLCPGPDAAGVRHAAGKLFGELRRRYREDPSKPCSLEEIASATGVDESPARVVVAALLGAGLLDFIPDTASDWPRAVRLREPILDYRDFEHLSGKLLERARLPKSYRGGEGGIAYVRPARFIEHLGRFREAALVCKTGFLLTLFRKRWAVPEDLLVKLRRQLPARTYYFPSSLAKGVGRFIADWKLIVPAHIYSRYLMATRQSEETARDVV